MQEKTEPRNERHTLMLTEDEVNDAKLVAALHQLPVGVLLREWAMRDIVAEAASTRARLVEVAASESAAA